MKNKHKHILSAITLVLFLFLAVGSSEDESNPEPQTRKEKIESQFSSWDGSHRKLEALIKESMNDPKSYEHVETKYWDMTDHLVVLTTFRGKNAFGGTVTNWVKAKVDLSDGTILEVLEQGR